MPLHRRPPRADTEPWAAPVATLDVDRGPVGASRFGTRGGWPVLWCHGGLSCRLDAAFLDAQANRLGAEIVAIDRPGIGRSGARDTPSVAAWADTVRDVADLLGIPTFAVAGWSAGGPYALACAAMMPDRVRAVATLAGMAPLEGGRDILELGLLLDKLLFPASSRAPRTAAALVRLATLAPNRLLRRQIIRTAGSKDRAALDGTHEWLVAAMREATACGVSGTVEDYRRIGKPWGFTLGQVQRSATVWQGQQDTLVPMDHARRLTAALPDGELRVVPSTGHYLPAVVAQAVLEELAP